MNIVAGSVSDLRGGHIYNTAYVFDRTGARIAQYDKTHLFSYAREHMFYTAGDTLCLFMLDGRTCALLICYDLRFPELARTLALSGAEVLFIPAQWPKKRRGHWETLLAARAIENQCYVCGVDRVGTDPACDYNGGTALIDAYGKTVAACPDGKACSLTATLDMDGLRAFRKKFPVLEDRD